VVAPDIRDAYINLPAIEVKQFQDALCQAARGAVTVRFMLSGQLLRLCPSTALRSAFADAAAARRARRSLSNAPRVEQCSPEFSAKAKKQPLI
jgi:hypothetical protein